MPFNQKLSVNIIVKNAEQTIDTCLQSVLSIADEIVVIDTGSTDGTLQKLEKYPIKVVQKKWEDDFSASRNEALAHSTGDWILYIDADEKLITDRGTIENMMISDAEAFWITIENYLTHDLSLSNKQRNVRMFRNRSQYRFKGRIHEQILYSILSEHSIEKVMESEVLIQHYGYTLEMVENQNKIQRNLQLLNLSIKEEPHEPFHFYNLGVEFTRLEEAEKAIYYLKECLQQEKRKTSYLPSVYYYLITNLIYLEDYQEAEKVLEKALHLYDDYTDLYYLLGQVHYKQYHFQKALECYYQTLECGPAPKKYISINGIESFLPQFWIGEIYRKFGHFEEALQRFLISLQGKPMFEEVYLAIGECLLSMEWDEEKIVHFFLEIHENNSADMLLIIQALCHLNQFDHALQLLSNYPEKNHITYFELKNECLMQSGKYLEAIQLQIKVFEEMGSHTPLNDDWLIDHLVCFWKEKLQVPLYVVRNRISSNRNTRWLFPIVLAMENEDYEEKDCDVEKNLSLLKRVLHFGFVDLAEQIKENLLKKDKLNLLSYSKLLYMEGYINRAAIIFLELLENQQLDVEATMYLGEILYDRNQFHEAAGLFEQVLEREPVHSGASTGAALSYLKEGHHLIKQKMIQFPQLDLINEQLIDIDESIKDLRKREWHTNWTVKQRGNFIL